MSSSTVAGASVGFGGGAAVGLAGGPFNGVTVPAGAAIGSIATGTTAFAGSLAWCKTGRWGGSGGSDDEGGDYRPKTRGAQEREQRNLNDIAKKHGIDRHAFGDFVEEEKAIEGRGSSTEYGYRELEALVERYKAAGGK